MSHEISTTVADEINRHHVLATVRADEAIHHAAEDRKSTRLNSSHSQISYAVFCLKKRHCRTAPQRAPATAPAWTRSGGRPPPPRDQRPWPSPALKFRSRLARRTKPGLSAGVDLCV